MKFSELNKEPATGKTTFANSVELHSLILVGFFPPRFPLASKENTEGSLSGGIHHITDKLSEGAETGC